MSGANFASPNQGMGPQGHMTAAGGMQLGPPPHQGPHQGPPQLSNAVDPSKSGKPMGVKRNGPLMPPALSNIRLNSANLAQNKVFDAKVAHYNTYPPDCLKYYGIARSQNVCYQMITMLYELTI